MPETSLYSIDRANKTKKLQNGYQTGDVCEIGYIAQETFPEFYQSGKAKLFIGKDASEIIESFHETFDFVILDTAHIHPIETLNFLTILPYLTDDAVVVLDDVMLHFESLSHSYATRLLFDTVVADKLCIDGDDYISQNVVAFQITADTHKYIADVFRSLMFPWNMLTSDIEMIQPFIERHYDDKLVHAFKLARKFNEDNLFRQAIGMRVDWFADVCGKIQKSSREYAFNAKKQTVESKLSLLKGKNVFFYGGGNYGKQIIAFLKSWN